MCGAEMFALKKIAAVVPMPYHGFDAHSGAHMLRAAPEAISPFIGIDSYTMPQPFFGPHPHAGMSAVSLMLPEADGGFINRDSLGDHSLIRPGDLHWTQAGRGMMHEEVPAEPGKAARGMQIFVNMRREHKQADPVAFKVKHEDMPAVQVEGGIVRVVAGSFADQSSPISQDARWLTRVNMLDITLAPGASVDIPVAAGDNAFFVMRSGSVHIDNFDQKQDSARMESTQSAIIFEASESLQAARITAGGEPLRGVFFSGTPIHEPVFPGGPFMGNTAEDIMAYKRAFSRGAMGHLDCSF
jgi:redox-sensitive bicupin YhaK (pirin superfamily)